MSKVSIVHSRRQLKVETDDIPLFEKARQRLSVFNPASKYSQWASDTFSPISPLGYFGPGLAQTVIREFRKVDPSCAISVSEEAERAIRPIRFSAGEIVDYCPDGMEERDYQRRAIKEALMSGRCLIELPTSSGKSFIIYSIVRNLLNKHHQVKNVLVIVPTLQLVKQLHRDFLDYGCGEGLVQMFSSFVDGPPGEAPIVISNRQWLEKHCDEIPVPSAVFVDEVHQLSPGNKVTRYVNRLPTDIRFGCTGTLPKDQIARWGIIGAIGPVVCSIKAHQMQAEDHIARISIKPIMFMHPDRPRWKVDDDNYDRMHRIEYEYVEGNARVMDVMSKFAARLPNNTLVLFDHTEHGKALFARIGEVSAGSRICRFINGEVPVEEREETRRLMEENDNVVLVANCKAAGVGLNIRNLHNIVFAMSGKSETKVIQAVGRMLRLNDNKTVANLYDFFHDLKYSKRHFEERRRLYREHYRKETGRPATVTA